MMRASPRLRSAPDARPSNEHRFYVDTFLDTNRTAAGDVKPVSTRRRLPDPLLLG
jgi:hypothetical protein